MLQAIADPFSGKIHEEKVGQRVNDLGSIGGGIVVLVESTMNVLRKCCIVERLTSSHQLIVDVTGDHRPSWDGGYATEGSQERIRLAILGNPR